MSSQPQDAGSSKNASSSTFFGIVGAVRQSLMSTNAQTLAAILGPTLAIAAIASSANDGDLSAATPAVVTSLVQGLSALLVAKYMGEPVDFLAAMKTYGSALSTIGSAMYTTQYLLNGSSSAPISMGPAMLTAHGTQVFCLATVEAARLQAIALTEKAMGLGKDATDAEVLTCLSG